MIFQVNSSSKNSCSLPTCLLDCSDSCDCFRMKIVKTFRVCWSWRCDTNRNYCCLRSLTQHSISNNKVVWGNEAALPDSLSHSGLSQGSENLKYLFQSVPARRYVLIDFLHSQAPAWLQDQRESLCLLFRKSSSCRSPKTCLFLVLSCKGARCFWGAAGSSPVTGNRGQPSPQGDGVSLPT